MHYEKAYTGPPFVGLPFQFSTDDTQAASLIGVILIAQPTFFFGDFELHHPGNEFIAVDHLLKKVTPAQRLIAVGSVCFSYFFEFLSIHLVFVRVALLGVVGSTGACSYFILPKRKGVTTVHLDTTLRAIGKQAHPLHSMSYFSAVCVLVSTMRYV
jgi:hypothetical protein